MKCRFPGRSHESDTWGTDLVEEELGTDRGGGTDEVDWGVDTCVRITVTARIAAAINPCALFIVISTCR